MLTRVQRRFLTKIAKAVMGFAVLGVCMVAAYMLLRTLDLEHGDASIGAALIVIILGMIGSGLKMVWEQSCYEIERETQRVDDALKGRL